MTGFVTWLGDAVVASAMLMLVVLAVRRPVTRAFGPGAAYALWLLPALRMVLPPLPAGWLPGEAQMVFDPPRMVGITNVPAAPLSHSAGIDWLLPLVGLWAAGALLYFAWQLLSHHLFLQRSLAGSVLVTRAAGIEVRQCPEVAGPMATGVLRRRILLPGDFTDRFTPEERRLALAHETAHHCRGDLAANLAGLALLSLHWWNPLAHLAFRAFRDDQEAACDATVLGAETAERRHAYGSAILKSASCRVPGAACALNHAGTMKRRILIMIDGRKSRALRLGGVALAAALVGAGLVATASTVAAPAHHSVHIQGKGDAMTITEDGVTRRATPAERREIERNVARAEAGAREAERGAERAMRQAELAFADMPRPPRPPRAPRAAVAPQTPETPYTPETPETPQTPETPMTAPTPPTPPAPPSGHRFLAFADDANWPIDRAALRAEIDAAMADARQAVAEARIELTAANAEARRAMAEASIARRQALKDAERARREAREAARTFERF